MKTALRYLLYIGIGWLALAPGTAYCQAADHKAAADRLLARGRAERAALEYRKALALHPASTAAYFNLAIAEYQLKNLDGAAWALERLLEIDSEDVEALYNLGCLELYRQDLQKAEIYFKKAREYCERDPRFFPLIDQGLGFLDELEGSSSQGLVLLALQKGLPSLTLNA